MMEINILSHCKEFIPNPCPDSCMRGSNFRGRQSNFSSPAAAAAYTAAAAAYSLSCCCCAGEDEQGALHLRRPYLL